MPKWDIVHVAKKTNCLDLKRYALSALPKIRTGLKEREISREKYNEYMKDYHKKLHNQRKAEGICTRCGKVSVKGTGYYTCIKCREKERKNIYPREYGWARVAEGKCFFCGEPVKKGYKVCEKHWKSNCENAKKADRSYLQRTNKLFFRKKGKCVNEKENSYLDCENVIETAKAERE